MKGGLKEDPSLKLTWIAIYWNALSLLNHLMVGLSVCSYQRGGKLLPIHSLTLHEIQTMFSQLAKQSARVLPAVLCTDHAHNVKNHRTTPSRSQSPRSFWSATGIKATRTLETRLRSTVLRRNKNMAVQGGTVSHNCILVIRKFIDFMSLFVHSMWFSFSVKQFPSAEFGCATYSCV